MIKAKELRIGNLATIDGNVVEIYEVTHSVIEIANGAEPYSINDIEPIPITEDWLLKFGFEIQKTTTKSYHIDCSNGWDSVIFADMQPEGDFWIGIRSISDGENYVLHTDVKHVHQIQNLYFSLTGDELL